METKTESLVINVRQPNIDKIVIPRKMRRGSKIGKGRKIHHTQTVPILDSKGEVMRYQLGRVIYKTIFHYSDKMN